jgi:hypothetical protein
MLFMDWIVRCEPCTGFSFCSTTIRTGEARVALACPVAVQGTIVRLLKRGIEEYSRTDEGALYSFDGFKENRSAGVR